MTLVEDDEKTSHENWHIAGNGTLKERVVPKAMAKRLNPIFKGIEIQPTHSEESISI